MASPSTRTLLTRSRRGFFLAIVVLGLVGLCSGGPVSAKSPPPLRLAASGSSSSDETEQLPCNKVYLRLAQEALRRADIEYECHALPWRRAQLMVRSGELDAMITLATAERAEYSVAVQETLYQLPLRAFTSASHPRLVELARLRRLSELRGWQVISYFGDGWAQSRLPRAGVSVAWSRDLATVLNQLVALRGDLTISAEVEAMPLIQALGLSDQLVVLPHVFDTLDFKFLMSKQSPHLDKLPAIAAAIRSMRDDGTIARMSGEADPQLEVVAPAAE